MNRHRLPLVFMALVAAATALPAVALPPSDLPPVRVELVDDATLGAITGKFFGADMLTGVRIDMVSNLAAANGGTAQASGSLYIRRGSAGYEVYVDSRATAEAGSTPAAPTTNVATGGQHVAVHGIGQISQIAGDGNRMQNVAIIRVGGEPAAPEGFNGSMGAYARTDDVSARVSFIGGGLQVGAGALGATIRQDVLPGHAGRVMQLGQITGNGVTASNSLQLQMMTTAMPTLSMQQLGIQQALAALSGLRR
jgi:hypothetical protein